MKTTLATEDGRKIRRIPITPRICAEHVSLDTAFVILGRVGSRWLPADVISIGSIIGKSDSNVAKVHVTFNPLHVQRFRQVLDMERSSDEAVH
jgi:hypothetical protein